MIHPDDVKELFERWIGMMTIQRATLTGKHWRAHSRAKMISGNKPFEVLEQWSQDTLQAQTV